MTGWVTRGGSNPFSSHLGLLKSPQMHGEDVRTVQTALTKHFGASLDLDGIYGELTVGAVGVFQRGHQLEHDRVVGPLTAKALGIQLS